MVVFNINKVQLDFIHYFYITFNCHAYKATLREIYLTLIREQSQLLERFETWLFSKLWSKPLSSDFRNKIHIKAGDLEEKGGGLTLEDK